MKIAIVGSGISGLAAASALHAAGHSITVYERDGHVGGHAYTQTIRFNGASNSSTLLEKTNQEKKQAELELGEAEQVEEQEVEHDARRKPISNVRRKIYSPLSGSEGNQVVEEAEKEREWSGEDDQESDGSNSSSVIITAIPSKQIAEAKKVHNNDATISTICNIVMDGRSHPLAANRDLKDCNGAKTHGQNDQNCLAEDTDALQVDTGFMVFNHVTYTNMITWFENYGVDFEQSDMSLAVSISDDNGKELMEWGSDSWALLARKENLISPDFYRMMKDMLKLNKDALEYLAQFPDVSESQSLPDNSASSKFNVPKETLGEFVQRLGYSSALLEYYLVPVCAAVWSCPKENVLSFPIWFILRFFKNHHYLQLTNRPQWYTIAGRAQEGYVQKVTAPFRDCIKTCCPVASVANIATAHGTPHVKVTLENGSSDVFDHVIIASHAPETIKMLGNSITSEEKSMLETFPYQSNVVYLHSDTDLMPKRKQVWSSWNFMGTHSGGVFVTYWLNRLQNLDPAKCHGREILVSLNPTKPPRPDLTYSCWETGHPVPTIEGAQAQIDINNIQGKRNIWFAGAYLGYGFHEDGCKSGFAVANLLLETFSLPKAPAFFKLSRTLPVLQVVQPTWIESASRVVVNHFLRKFVIRGKLEVRDIGGQAQIIEGSEDLQDLRRQQGNGLSSTCKNHVVINVVRPAFYSKIAARHDLGLADAYIDGDFECSNVVGFLEFLILNREAHEERASKDAEIASAEALKKANGFWSAARRAASAVASSLPFQFAMPTVGSPITAIAGVGMSYLAHLFRSNTLANSRRNIHEHYDLSNDMFALFLDQTMTYSSGIFRSPTDTLYQAQLNKLNSFIQKARIRSTDHVLEIGFGWGSLSMAMVKATGCRVTGITLSEQQKKLAEERVKAAGLQDRIQFEMCDYRMHQHASGPSFKYDRIVSCEMMEAVGHEYLGEYFFHCSRLMKKDGILVVQVITTPDFRYQEYRRSTDFIKEQIFPGCCCPSVSSVVSASSERTDLVVEHAENIGFDYAKTLECWRINFNANIDKIVALGFDEHFIRKWRYYLMYCEAGFRTRTLGDYQFVLSRPGNANMGLPLTSI